MDDGGIRNLILGNNAGGPSVTPLANGVSPPADGGSILDAWKSTGLGGDTLAMLLPQLDDSSAAHDFDPSVAQSRALGGDTMAGILGPIPDIDARQSLPPSLVSDEDSKEVRGQKALAALNAEMSRQGISGTIYPDFKTALGAWADAAQPIQRQYDAELNSKIYLNRDGWQIGPAYSNGERTSTNIVQDNGIPGGSYWGYIHTHPDNVPLDYRDEQSADHSEGSDIGGFAYVALPNGQINGWAPSMGLSDTPQFVVRPPTLR